MMNIYDNIFDLDTVVKRADALSVNLGEEIGLMNVEKGNYYGMGETGSSIWKIIEEPHSIKKVIEKLLLEYNVDENVCKEHVFEFINRLLDEELIVKM